MPGIERCDSPEPIPHLEPLSAANSGFIHDSPTTITISSSPTPLSEGMQNGSEKKHQNHTLCQSTRDITTSLKIRFVLENKGNVARDHLASERTYLAYVRTSLACASAGVALLQLLTMNVSSASTSGFDPTKFAQPICAMIIFFGLIILLFGVWRYFATQSALVRGYFPVARYSIATITFVLGSLVIIVFAIILAET